MRVFPKLCSKILSATALLAFAVTLALAGAAVSIRADADFGFVDEDQRGFAPQQFLQVIAQGSEEVYSFDVASRVGGVILQATAHSQNAGEKLNISYDPSADDGHRFKVKIGTDTGEIVGADWEIIPLIRFVNTPYTAAMSLLGRPKNQAERFAENLKWTMFIEIHPDLKNTILGNNFIFTDAMLVGGSPGNIRKVTESLSEPVHGYTDLANFDEAKSSQAASRIASKLVLAGMHDDWNTYIFTDVGVNFVFSIRDKKLEISGAPFYAFLKLDWDENTSKLNNDLTEFFRNSADIQALNPKIYTLDRKAFQIAAVLRNFKAGDSSEWTALLNQVTHVNPEPSMKTPRAWIPPDPR